MADVFPIKVCGITRLEDAQLALDLGAFALGFVFYKKSPRYIAPSQAREICQALVCNRPFTSVGVCVNETEAELLEVYSESRVDILQLHGDEGPDVFRKLKDVRLWKAVRVKDEGSFAGLKEFEPFVEAFVFDASSATAFGGTGERIDSRWFSLFPREKPFLLAGGVGPDNWEDLFGKVKPFAVDLSSSVETAPGVKSAALLEKLFHRKGTSA